MRGRQLENVLERRARREREPEREDLVERDRVELGADAGRLQQRLHLGGEVEASVDATCRTAAARPCGRAPARAGCCALSQIAKAKSPLKSSTQSGALLLVGVQDDLGVGIGAEAVAARDQVRAQLDVVEDLAVEGDADRRRRRWPSAAGRWRDR